MTGTGDGPLLRREGLGGRGLGIALGILAAVGAAAALLVAAGNPGNMGICGACFLRDLSGALGLFGKGPQIFRPEAAGLVLGAFAWMALRGRFAARSGSHAAARFLLGMAMGLGALVFLGCPFRMLQRLGGGDLNAAVAAAGMIAGVGAALLLEGRGYSVGRTSPAPAAVGLLAPFAALLLLALFLGGGVLLGPGPGEGTGPPHAAYGLALAVGLGAGAALSATGFCAVSAARQVYRGPRPMLLAAGALVLAYGAGAAAPGRGKGGGEGGPLGGLRRGGGAAGAPPPPTPLVPGPVVPDVSPSPPAAQETAAARPRPRPTTKSGEAMERALRGMSPRYPESIARRAPGALVRAARR